MTRCQPSSDLPASADAPWLVLARHTLPRPVRADLQSRTRENRYSISRQICRQRSSYFADSSGVSSATLGSSKKRQTLKELPATSGHDLSACVQVITAQKSSFGLGASPYAFEKQIKGMSVS